MAEPELDKLVDEHIALLAEARAERDHYRQLSGDYLSSLRQQQEINIDLLAALENATVPVANPSQHYCEDWDEWFCGARADAIAKAKGD